MHELRKLLVIFVLSALSGACAAVQEPALLAALGGRGAGGVDCGGNYLDSVESSFGISASGAAGETTDFGLPR